MPSQTFFDLSKEKQNRILAAARRVFVTVPYEKVTIQSIIEMADIPRGSFYQYFTDKKDLYHYCLREIYIKAIAITYRENMNFYWEGLYNEFPENRGEMPWFLATSEDMKKAMSEDEFRLAMEPPSRNNFQGIDSEIASIVYPYLQKHIKNAEITRSSEKQKLLSFQFSLTELLVYEYEEICGVSREDASCAISMLNRTLLDAFRDKSSSEMATLLKTMVSLRCLSDSGLNLTFDVEQSTFSPKNDDEGKDAAKRQREEKNSADISEGSKNKRVSISDDGLMIPIHSGSLTGKLSCDAVWVTDGSSKPNDAAYLRIEFFDKRKTSCKLTASGMTFTLGEHVTIIGTAVGGKKLCVMENGEFCYDSL